MKSFSQKLYDIYPVREFGLIARRECRVCASSSDGVFALKNRNQAGLHIFVGLCVLEIKTKASENTASDLAQQVMAEGRNFVVCNAGDEEFKQAIPENAYRSQVCQHAAALGLSYVLIVYCTPGALPKQ